MLAVKDYLCEPSSHSSHFDQLNFLQSCAAAAEELNNSRLVINCIQEFMKCTTLVEGFPEEVPLEENGVECKGSPSVADFCLFPLLFLSDEMEKGHGASEMDVLDLVKSGRLQHVSLFLGIDADFHSFKMGQTGTQQQECGFFE